MMAGFGRRVVSCFPAPRMMHAAPKALCNIRSRLRVLLGNKAAEPCPRTKAERLL